MNSTNLEKEPLLPLNIQHKECPCVNKGIKYYFPRLLVLAIIMYFFNSGGVRVNTIDQSLSSSSNVLKYDESTNGISAICRFDRSYPFKGQTNFIIDQKVWNQLAVSEKRHNRNGISNFFLTMGETKVIENKNLDKIAIDLDIKFTNEKQTETVWIENIENEESGKYELVINIENPEHGTSGCVRINTIIQLPSLDALDLLTLDFSNIGVNLVSGLTLKDLTVNTVNGQIEYKELTTNQLTITTVNGSIKGTTAQLYGNALTDTVNGHVEVKYSNILTDNAQNGISIKGSSVNGGLEIELPDSFDSTYRLTSVNGRRSVDSTKPEKLHTNRSRRGTLSGYYGDNEDTKNKVNLDTVNGRIELIYA